MQSLSLKGTTRVGLTTIELKKLRADGNVPCVLYGSGTENIHFFIPSIALRNLVYTPSVYTVNLDIDGTTHTAVMREIQFHPVKDNIIHVDFQMIFENKPVIIHVPVKLNGTAPGVKEGGKLIQKLRKLHVMGLSKHLPDNVELDISALNIGDSIRVSDVKRDGIEFLDSSNNIIVAVRVTREVVEEVPVAAVPVAGAAPVAGAPGAAPAAGAAAPAAGAPAAKPAEGKPGK